ncbi:uncharacterized protein MONBRDRAFT_22037 [Monosiga brevicollis MX1]|uniref:Magnesium transporter n=1 Tax=Monosiga brevicollis TaxID=81824 RepID=A9UPC9_MONBE|nr:uncharacterized protein MONBRDRAFT_22037 [Monosiga brevicollis MX1]EDQ92854.1 predicted protein [Monosiga brevicollis MX1]|eukprot:XP_001742616.1 hypothetical protein [Monosiga brevicollis MX1]
MAAEERMTLDVDTILRSPQTRVTTLPSADSSQDQSREGPFESVVDVVDPPTSTTQDGGDASPSTAHHQRSQRPLSFVGSMDEEELASSGDFGPTAADTTGHGLSHSLANITWDFPTANGPPHEQDEQGTPATRPVSVVVQDAEVAPAAPWTAIPASKRQNDSSSNGNGMGAIIHCAVIHPEDDHYRREFMSRTKLRRYIQRCIDNDASLMAENHRSQKRVRTINAAAAAAANEATMPLGASLAPPTGAANPTLSVASAPADPTAPTISSPLSRAGGRSAQGAGGKDTDGVPQRIEITSRDMRQLDTATATSSEPFIRVRRGAILVKMGPYHAIVTRRELRMLLRDGADEALGRVLNCLPISESGSLPFELAVIDVLLTSCIEMLSDRVRNIEDNSTSTLRAIRKQSASQELEKLRDHKAELRTQIMQAQRLHRAIDDVLDDDNELLFMQLTRIVQEPLTFTDAMQDEQRKRELTEITEAQMEDYLQRLSDLLMRLDLVSQRIEFSETTVTFKLDTMRNRLLAIGMFLNVLTAILAGGALIAGFFDRPFFPLRPTPKLNPGLPNSTCRHEPEEWLRRFQLQV